MILKQQKASFLHVWETETWTTLMTIIDHFLTINLSIDQLIVSAPLSHSHQIFIKQQKTPTTMVGKHVSCAVGH